MVEATPPAALAIAPPTAATNPPSPAPPVPPPPEEPPPPALSSSRALRVGRARVDGRMRRRASGRVGRCIVDWWWVGCEGVCGY